MTLKILDSARTVRRNIIRSMFFELDTMLYKSSTKIERRVKINTFLYLTGTDTYKSLIFGDLRKEFGFYKGTETAVVSDIINEFINQIHVTEIPFKVTGSGYSGGIRVDIIEKDFSKVLSLPSAEIFTEKQELLPWLEWLLLMGKRVIVKDYVVDFRSDGRSGGAIMIPEQGESWRVPPEFAGTKTKNWITRAIKDSDKYSALIQKIIIEEIIKAIP